MLQQFWNDFTDWLSKSFNDHPLWTITFGVMCFLLGGFIF